MADNQQAAEEIVERDDLALQMLAAWLNVRVDQIPPENRAHLNPHTMAAWKRVGDAARQLIEAETREKVEAIAARLSDQRDEPWPNGTESDRLHYWRDKALTAAQPIRSMGGSDHG